MPRRYDRPLYIQPFDHRGSFQSGLFGFKPPLSDAQTAEIAGSKQIIYYGFRAALGGGAPAGKAGIVLGRGENDQKVREWLGTARKVPGFIGFAVGRTVFWDPLVDWKAGKATREQAVARIASRYREFVDLFEGK
jgi:hypothetical protein